MFFAKNSILDVGNYNFEDGTYMLALDWWYSFNAEGTGLGGKFLPKTEDHCSTIPLFKIDERTAELWRDAMNKKHFSLTIWYRFKKAIRKQSWINPHWTNGTVAYDLLFDVEVLGFEASTDRS